MQPFTTANAPRPGLRILYALGPGDVVGLFRDLQAGKAPAFKLSLSFSEQFLDWCNSAGAVAHLLASNPAQGVMKVGPHTVENAPRSPLYFAGGMKHYLGSALYGLKIMRMALRDHADVVIVDSGMTQWIVLMLLWLLRIPVIGVIHSALWPRGFPPTRRKDRILLWLDGLYFRRFAAATVSVSPECERQVREVAGKVCGPMFQFKPLYHPNFLNRVVPPLAQPPLNLLFLGRIEEYKGVFLILEAATRLEQEMPGRFAWKIVGSGPAEERLRHSIATRGLGDVIEVPGPFRDEQGVLDAFGWAHVIVAPTTSGFFEGFAMVAAEAVLASRPVVMSTVVPAWEVLGDAAIQVEADSVDALMDAVRELAEDPAAYMRARRATAQYQEQFYDSEQGIGAVLGRVVTLIAL